MIQITDLITANGQHGLWHGTRADLKDGLIIGSDAVGDAQNIIKIIWEAICESTDAKLEDLHSEDVMKFFSHQLSKDRAVSLGNSIRFLRKDFNYSVIAFAFDSFSAEGYAREGSELANAILSLIDSALLEYPNIFQNQSILEKIKSARKTASQLLSSKGKILRLVKMPARGYFCSPSKLDHEVKYLSREPFPERIIFTELFFTESIPLDHFIIREI